MTDSNTWGHALRPSREAQSGVASLIADRAEPPSTGAPDSGIEGSFPDSMSSGDTSCASVLEACAITHSYGRKLVLDRVSLSVDAGEVVAIVGENGAGKSTLMRICAGLVRPDVGDVRLQGRVGYCPQIPGLFDLLNADEHLLLLAPALGLSDRAVLDQGRSLLGELGFPVGDSSPTRYLSGGARQKLNLALALLGGVRVLLLDEPYQGFDHGAYVSFWEHVARWSTAGLGVVVVTHLLTDLALVDRVVELTIPRTPSRGCEGAGR